MVFQTIEKTEYESKLLDVVRVTRVVAGGRRFRFRAAVVVGNRRGKVGIGVAKGQDVSLAVEKATTDAKKRLVEIPLSRGNIPHSTSAKYGSSKVLLNPGLKGRGLVAGGAVRTVCDLAGIKDISAKILGRTKNKLNNARATIKALTKLKTKNEKGKT